MKTNQLSKFSQPPKTTKYNKKTKREITTITPTTVNKKVIKRYTRIFKDIKHQQTKRKELKSKGESEKHKKKRNKKRNKSKEINNFVYFFKTPTHLSTQTLKFHCLYIKTHTYKYIQSRTYAEG